MGKKSDALRAGWPSSPPKSPGGMTNHTSSSLLPRRRRALAAAGLFAGLAGLLAVAGLPAGAWGGATAGGDGAGATLVTSHGGRFPVSLMCLAAEGQGRGVPSPLPVRVREKGGACVFFSPSRGRCAVLSPSLRP